MAKIPILVSLETLSEVSAKKQVLNVESASFFVIRVNGFLIRVDIGQTTTPSGVRYVARSEYGQAKTDLGAYKTPWEAFRKEVESLRLMVN